MKRIGLLKKNLKTYCDNSPIKISNLDAIISASRIVKLYIEIRGPIDQIFLPTFDYTACSVFSLKIGGISAHQILQLQNPTISTNFLAGEEKSDLGYEVCVHSSCYRALYGGPFSWMT